jgi:ABC-type transport system involved in multi-copper enzyme maturation permease subunit
MIFSPILHVELLTVGRRRRYFFARVVYALILLVVMGFCYLAVFDRGYKTPTLNDQAEFARAFFTAFSWIQLIVVLGLTPAMIAGTISVEHERKTIDYLLTTQLSDTEIALGKFAARLWSVLMQLAVGLPILGIGLMLGGVSPEQMVASFGLSFVTLIFTATLSLAISSRAAKSREAITRAYLVIIAWLVVPPILSGICEMLIRTSWPNVSWAAQQVKVPLQWLLEVHPCVQLTVILSDRPAISVVTRFLGMSGFNEFALTYLGASAVLAVSAVVGVRRFYLKSAGRSESAKKTWRDSVRTALDIGRRPVGNDAMLWKEITSLRSAINLGWAGTIAAALLYGVALFFIGMGLYWTLDDNDWQRWKQGSPLEWTSMIEVPMIFGLMILLITSNAAASITGEKERDTWITLMSTPVEGSEIVKAKLWAVIFSMRYWYAMIVLCWGLAAIFRPLLLVVLPFVVGIHLISAMFAACVGLRCSLHAKSSLKSMGTALAIIVLGVSIAPLMFSGFVAVAARGDEAAGIFYGSSLPALFSSVQPIGFTISTQDRLSGSSFPTFVVGCIVWTVIYACATGFLYQQLTTSFDEYAGRLRPRSGAPSLPRTRETNATSEAAASAPPPLTNDTTDEARSS